MLGSFAEIEGHIMSAKEACMFAKEPSVSEMDLSHFGTGISEIHLSHLSPLHLYLSLHIIHAKEACISAKENLISIRAPWSKASAK